MEERVRLSLLARKSVLSASDLDPYNNFAEHWLNELVAIEGISISAPLYHSIVIAFSALVGFFGSWFGTAPAFFSAASTAFYLWRIFPKERTYRAKKIMLPELASFLETMSRLISSGHHVEWAFVQAVRSVSQNGVVRPFLAPIARAVRQGASLERTLEEAGARQLQPEFIDLVRLLKITARRGSRSAEALSNTAETLRRRNVALERVTRDVATITHLFWIVFVLAALATLFLLLVHPEYFSRAYDDELGEMFVEYSIATVIVCLVWFRKITLIST
jgi:Flp pilus assembly protein TadB